MVGNGSNGSLVIRTWGTEEPTATATATATCLTLRVFSSKGQRLNAALTLLRYGDFLQLPSWSTRCPKKWSATSIRTGTASNPSIPCGITFSALFTSSWDLFLSLVSDFFWSNLVLTTSIFKISSIFDSDQIESNEPGVKLSPAIWFHTFYVFTSSHFPTQSKLNQNWTWRRNAIFLSMTFYETRCNRLKHVVQRVTVAVNYSGNLLVIYLFIKSKRLRNPANSLVINLAFSDLGMMLSQFPIFIWNTFNGGVWSFGPLACQIYAATGSAFGMCSICTMAAIAYDRYNVIAKGVQSVRLTTGNFVLLRCSVSLLFSIPPPPLLLPASSP